jgi:hypothetical protein
MRWIKIIGLLGAGAVIGGLLAGYMVFEYMERFGIAWNQWASSQYDEQRASDALGTVAALSQIRAGSMEEARRILEWRLTGEIPELARMKRDGRDPEGYTSRALSAIKDYKQANSWSSGSKEVDKLTSDTLSGATDASSKTH